MAQSHHKKVLKQLENKPGKMAKWKKHNVPKDRSFGKKSKKCSLTGATRGVIHKYGLKVCRRTFRANALELGFKKYN
jgi:small subunit ribosomal protein S14